MDEVVNSATIAPEKKVTGETTMVKIATEAHNFLTMKKATMKVDGKSTNIRKLIEEALQVRYHLDENFQPRVDGIF